MPRLRVIVVRPVYARCGSTLLMHVLAGCPDVAMERTPPYEDRRLARWLAAGGSREDAWPASTRYAEKWAFPVEPLLDVGVEVDVIDLIRDPRDVLVSVDAFARRSGRDQFGYRVDLPLVANLPSFLVQYAARVEQLRSDPTAEPGAMTRYEDLLTDPDGSCARLGRRLGLALDPARIVERPRGALAAHQTAVDAGSSLGRWRRELDPAVVAVVTRMLAPVLDAYGYPA